MPTTDPRPLAEQLLSQLTGEEELLRQARECVMGLYASLRKGDMPAIQAALPRSDSLAARLQAYAEQRETAAAALAATLGLPPDASLQQLAAAVPEPFGPRLLAARSSLQALGSQVHQFRAANANLIERLRCFFSDVLSGLTAPDVPARYGPTGNRLTVHTAPATVVSG
ncbi:MAG: flagellar protein FlgN [Fimbriiglobus sp.]|jgi:hypothetical protein|nr:flagellar protein FlgN [Fimbriiglobus sp.]